jgi:hypothetical protein
MLKMCYQCPLQKYNAYTDVSVIRIDNFVNRKPKNKGGSIDEKIFRNI